MKQFSTKYILRIDDVCQTMDWELFSMIADACEDLGIAPIVGVVPDNQDQKLMVSRPYPLFWEYIKEKASRGWIIAQHGYQHAYAQNRKTEFAGLPYQEQYKKIHLGQELLREKLGFAPIWWMAPAHTFDQLTCKALKNLGFQYITDGIALYPYSKSGLTWVPQQLWRPRAMPFGTWTICIHTNTMSFEDIDALIDFMKNHASKFREVSFTPRISIMNIPFAIVWRVLKLALSL